MPAVSIDLAGFIPQTVEVFRQIAKDWDYRNAHEANQAKLDEARAAAEIEKLQSDTDVQQIEKEKKILELEAMRIENKKRTLELEGMRFTQLTQVLALVAPDSTPEARLAIAARIYPDLQLLFESRVTIIVDQPPSQ